MNIEKIWVDVLDGEYLEDVKLMLTLSIEDDGVLGFSSGEEELIDQYLESLKSEVKQNKSFLLLAKADDENAYMVVLKRRPFPNMKHQGELAKAFVNPKFRGITGLVKGGLKEASLKAKDVGIEKILLDVREGSRPAALWQAFGFNTYGIMEDYSRSNGNVYRGLFMDATVTDLLEKHK